MGFVSLVTPLTTIALNLWWIEVIKSLVKGFFFLHFAKVLKHIQNLNFETLFVFNNWCLEKNWIFCHPKFEQCYRTDNQTNNHRAVNLSKTPQTSYPTHHLILILLDFWPAHCQPCTSKGLQKYLARWTHHQHNPESVKSLKAMILNELSHDDSKKLSWHCLWSTQRHILTMLLWTSTWRSCHPFILWA